MAIDREHSWPRAIFMIVSISMCICVDILQHAAPLPFLPQHLEEHGHDSAEIAAVMGGYYWSGFLGGCLITAYQIQGVLMRRYEEDQWRLLRGHVLKLIAGLFAGGATLLVEAKAHKVDGFTMHQVHLMCRLVQGFIGAFLFFYAYLLSVACFKGSQQIFALTATTISLNVAEVFGPFVGATIFSQYGLAEAYYVLAALSVLNSVFLVGVWFIMPTDALDHDIVAFPEEATALLHSSVASAPSSRLPSPHASPKLPPSNSGVLPDTAPPAGVCGAGRMERLKSVLTNRLLIASCMCIAPAAMVKSSMEGILPLFAAGQGYTEFEVGQLFTAVALGFILSATLLGYLWDNIGFGQRAALTGLSLLVLGGLACLMLHSYGADVTIHSRGYGSWVAYLNGNHHFLFYSLLVSYGVLLGLTHTAPALYLGEVLDSLEEDSQCKQAANGIWNTGWEAGGSLGFIAAGVASTDSWREEQAVLTSLGMCVVVAAAVFMAISWTSKPAAVKGERANERSALLSH